MGWLAQEREMSESADGHRLVQPSEPALTRDGVGPADDEFAATSALMRLLLGGILEGAETTRDRLHEWERAARSAAQPTRSQPASELLRYMVVGMLFEAEAQVRRRFSEMLSHLMRLYDEAEYGYTMWLTPALRHTPLDGLRKGLDEVLLMALLTADRWTARGWIEEQRGRGMARHATTSVIDELLDYMAHNPEVRRLIEQQGIDIADSAVDEVRERTASADKWIEQLARRLLHRRANDSLAKPTDTLEVSPSVTDGRAPPAPTAALRPSPQADVRRSASAAAMEAPSPGDPAG
jgi:hypothetical protein